MCTRCFFDVSSLPKSMFYFLIFSPFSGLHWFVYFTGLLSSHVKMKKKHTLCGVGFVFFLGRECFVQKSPCLLDRTAV